MKRWEIIIDNARREIDNVLHYLETEGDERAKLAFEASQRYGEQSKQMSDLAHRTREESEKHIKQAADIEKLSEEAIASASQANKEASDAIYGGEQISKQIAELKNRQNQLNESLSRTLDLAEEQKKAADEANNQAAVSLTNVEGVKIPSIDPKELQQEIDTILEESQNLVDSSIKENEQNDELFDEVERSVADARNELQSAQDQQRISDELMVDLDKARERIVDSLSIAEKTLKDAEATLETLDAFTAKIEQSRNDAIAEFSQIDKIEERLQKIADMNAATAAAIPGRRRNATEKKIIADGENAFGKELVAMWRERLAKEADAKDSANAIIDDIDQLMEELTDSKDNLNYYSKQAEDDKQMATEAVRKATLAKNSAIDANSTVLQEGEEIKKIIDALSKSIQT